MTTGDKPHPEKMKLAIYWGAACGGCCVSVLDTHEGLLDITAAAEPVFWPIALDTKYRDVEAMPDQYIDLTLFNGAIRNSENKHMAELLRRKSKILVAYGSCAHMGGIPGLANFFSKLEVINRVYDESESTKNPEKVHPDTHFTVREGELDIPEFYNEVYPLNKIVEVDYFIPGCPPQSSRLLEVFNAIVSGVPLPPKGSVIGALDKTNCDDCKRKKSDKKLVKRFYRPWEIEDDHETCFLEQGIICMGPATRGGCGVRCVEGNGPCRGCYGPPPGSSDPGAKMMSAIATMIDSNDPDEIDAIVDDIVDPAGLFYRFSLPLSILGKKLL
ncbi:MAG TPA: F420-nonreducing hydrogenase [Bacteroidales bacterium]|nr:F420-nonreducing hydrogenase [Bacteroidales bacterium]HPS73418.1 F420-nonreducing hydrogenase [Bacteroidales bacterium]